MHLTMRTAKTGTLVLVVAGLAAAVVHGLPEPSDVAVQPTVERDSSAWSMPLDAYVLTAATKTDYAEDLVEQPCLRAAGIDDPPPWATVAGLQAESDASGSIAAGSTSPPLAATRPLSAGQARDRGYRGPTQAGANRQTFRGWGFTAERNAAFAALPDGVAERCIRQARKTLGSGQGSGDQQASMLALNLTYLASVAARSDDDVVAAARSWRACMAPAGVPDLPDDPAGMPTASMTSVDWVTDIADADVPRAEVATAERDVACQRSSGWRSALYDAEWQRLLHVTASQAAVLRRGSTDNPAVEDRVDDAIRRLAPEAPAGVD